MGLAWASGLLLLAALASALLSGLGWLIMRFLHRIGGRVAVLLVGLPLAVGLGSVLLLSLVILPDALRIHGLVDVVPTLVLIPPVCVLAWAVAKLGVRREKPKAQGIYGPPGRKK